jgi:hypothetical protein
MVTEKQRRALTRPLIQRRPDLAFHRQYVFFRDIRHYLRGVFLEGGTYGGLTLRPFVFPLFDAAKFLYFRRIHYPPDGQRDRPYDKYYVTDKNRTDLNAEQTALEISDIIEREALPEIAHFDNPAALAKRPAYSDGKDHVLGACFNGDYDAAVMALDAYLESWKNTWALPSRVKRYKTNVVYKSEYEVFSIDLVTEEHKFHDVGPWRMAYLGKLLREDRSRIPALLHEWEEYTVNNFKLNKYWVRTPFPCDG